MLRYRIYSYSELQRIFNESSTYLYLASTHFQVNLMVQCNNYVELKTTSILRWNKVALSWSHFFPIKLRTLDQSLALLTYHRFHLVCHPQLNF